MIKNILHRVKCARYIRKNMSFPCFIVFMYNLFTAYYYSFLFYTGGGQLYIQKLHLIIQFYLNEVNL